VFNEVIKQYQCVKLSDTPLEQLEILKDEFTKMDTFSEYKIHIDFNDTTGEFKLKVNGNVVYEGIEGNVSVINLLRSMNLEYTMSSNDEHIQTIEEFEANPIIK
jgi:hypothetical protein